MSVTVISLLKVAPKRTMTSSSGQPVTYLAREKQLLSHTNCLCVIQISVAKPPCPLTGDNKWDSAGMDFVRRAENGESICFLANRLPAPRAAITGSTALSFGYAFRRSACGGQRMGRANWLPAPRAELVGLPSYHSGIKRAGAVFL